MIRGMFLDILGEGDEVISILNKSKLEITYIPMHNVRSFKTKAIKNIMEKGDDVSYV